MVAKGRRAQPEEPTPLPSKISEIAKKARSAMTDFVTKQKSGLAKLIGEWTEADERDQREMLKVGRDMKHFKDGIREVRLRQPVQPPAATLGASLLARRLLPCVPRQVDSKMSKDQDQRKDAQRTKVRTIVNDALIELKQLEGSQGDAASDSDE